MVEDGGCNKTMLGFFCAKGIHYRWVRVFSFEKPELGKIMKNLFDHSIYVDVFEKILGLPLFRNTPKSCFDFCFGG